VTPHAQHAQTGAMPALEESRVGHELDSKLLATVCKMAVRVVRLTVGYAAARRLAICGMLWAGPDINMCLQDNTDRSRNTPQSHSLSHAPYREAQTPRQLWYLYTLFDAQHTSASWCLHSISCISTTIKTLTVMCGSYTCSACRLCITRIGQLALCQRVSVISQTPKAARVGGVMGKQVLVLHSLLHQQPHLPVAPGVASSPHVAAATSSTST
jgi:hypothetical protein